MKNAAFVLALVISAVLGTGAMAQNSSLLKPGRYELTYYFANGGSLKEFGQCIFELTISNNKATMYTEIRPNNSNTAWTDTCISNSTTLAPVYHASHGLGGDYVLHYGNGVTGYYMKKENGKTIAVKDPAAKGDFIDEHFLSTYLTTLPLASGYKKKDIPIYAFSPDNVSNLKRYSVNEVKTSLYTSELTGGHPVWQVGVTQEGSPNVYTYYIDKNTQRVWRTEMVINGTGIVVVDNEADYNPFHSQFNKEEALKMVNEGRSTIDGQAFARDNGAGIKGMAVLNLNKKQCAPAGTTIVLIPYTDFFKEWFKLNGAARKKGKSVRLPKDAATCIKTTTVYDNDGHFEFTNLQPGEYMLMAQFGYAHGVTRKEVTGYTDTYIDGAYVGTSANTVTHNYNVGAVAEAKSVVTIKQDGEKVTMKLKKTL